MTIPVRLHLCGLFLLGTLILLPFLIITGCDGDDPAAPQTTPPPPEISWLDTTINVQGVVTLRFAVSGESPRSVARGYVDGRQVWEETELEGDTLSFDWDSRTVEDGTHAVEARVWDKNDLVGVSPIRMLWVENDTTTIDRTPPVVRWLYPEAGGRLQGIVGLPFYVEDEGGIRSIRIFRNGLSEPGDTLEEVGTGNMMYQWDSETVDDGYVNFEIFAYDSAGNEGRSPVMLAEVVNQSLTQIIFIPSDYPTIQAGINAAKEGDIIRISSGTYNEGLNFFGKNVWFESTEGPEVTIIDASGWTFGIAIVSNEDTTLVIRGFTLQNALRHVIAAYQGSFNIYNCILKNSDDGIITGHSNPNIVNCVITDMWNGMQISYSWGRIINNIIMNSRNYGFWNAAIYPNPMYHDYNCIYNNTENFMRLEPGDGYIFDDPLFIEGTFELEQESPCIDAGHPDILDMDGTRSDIGVYGGPYAYNPRRR